MNLFCFGHFYHIIAIFYINSAHGAFVEIGNLPATTSVHEDTTTSVLVYSVSVYPATSTCGFSSGNDDGNFMFTDIGNGEQQVWTSGSPSFSATLTPSYILTVTCPASGSPSDSQDLTVNVDANADFVLSNFVGGVATKSVSAKTVKIGHVVFTLEYTDDDGDSLTNTITNTDPDPAPFSFNGDYLVATHDLLEVSYTLYTIYFDATDGRNKQALELRLTITDVNTPPEITNLNHTLTLPELTAGRKLVFTINYQDNDGDAVLFEIVSKQDDSGVFDIILSTGEVYLKEGFELDYETTTQYQFELRIKDEYHYTTLPNKFLTIVIADVNEAPYWPSALAPKEKEESAAGAVVGTPSVLCDDPDGTPDVSAMEYRILFGVYSSYFSIDQTTAEVSFDRDWDYDDKTLPETFMLTLQCVDPDGVSASADYEITILDINDNDPVCNPFSDTLSLTYAQAASESITHLNCSDADSGNNSELVYSVSGYNEGYGKTYFDIDTTGNVTITKAFEMDFNSTFYVTVDVKDNGKPKRSTTVTLTVTYTEKPTVANWTEVTTCFLCTTSSVTLVSGAGFAVLMLCLFLGTLCVLRCCYGCEQRKMRKLIASEYKVKQRLCDCCRPKHHRRRRRKNAAEHTKEKQNHDGDMKTGNKIRFTDESKNQYNGGVAPPGAVVSNTVPVVPQATAEIFQPAEDSQWNKFRKAH